MNHVFHVADYNSPLPEMIYLDTGFIYEIYGNNPNNKFADDCYNFTNRLTANNSILVISALTFQELDHVVLKGIHKKYAERLSRNIGWERLRKQTDEYTPEVMTEIARITKILRDNPNVVELPVIMDEWYTEMRRRFMLDYSLDSNDAGHLVVALRNSVNTYAIIDGDYKNVSGINIFTPNENYPGLSKTPRYLIPPPESLEDKEDESP